jgi:hypothetical protein
VEFQSVITPYNAGSAHTIFMGWLNTLPGSQRRLPAIGPCEKAEEARKKIARVVSKALRTAAKKSEAKNAEGGERTQVDMADKA